MSESSDSPRLLASSVAVGSSGGITVLEGLGGALVNLPGSRAQIVIPAQLRQRLEASVPSHALIPISLRSTLSRLMWEERGLPRLAARGRFDVLLGMTNTLPVVSSFGGARGALLIQNIAPLLPEVRRLYRGVARARFEALQALTLWSVHRAEVTFLFTRCGRDLVSGLAPRARVVAIPPGGLPSMSLPEGEREIGDHILVLADLYRYKGVEQVIQALASPKLSDMRLIVAGAAMEPDYERALHETARRSSVTERVSFVGRVPRHEIIRLLRSARCLVQPSHVESLALPMLEALQLRVPVVSTDIPVARELCGEAATYFPSGDIVALVESLADLPTSPVGQIPSRFDWNDTARALIAALRSPVLP